MRLRTALLSATLVLFAPLLSAQVTYDYTGTDFTYFYQDNSGPYTGADFVTGSVTLASALPANDNGGGVPSADIVQYSFSVDGIQTISSSDVPTPYSNFIFFTDANGNITEAIVNLGASGSGNGQIGINSFIPISDAYLGGSAGNGAVPEGAAYSAGTWMIAGQAPVVNGPSQPTVGATPEPSSFVLLFTALLGFGFVARKQLVPRLLPAGRILR